MHVFIINLTCLQINIYFEFGYATGVFYAMIVIIQARRNQQTSLGYATHGHKFCYVMIVLIQVR
jgi:hypothetical protein